MTLKYEREDRKRGRNDLTHSRDNLARGRNDLAHTEEPVDRKSFVHESSAVSAWLS